MIKLALIVLISISLCIAQSPDYAASLFYEPSDTVAQRPYIIVDPFKMGDRAYSIMMHFKYDDTVYPKTLFHAYTDGIALAGDQGQVRVTLLAADKLRVVIGKEDNKADIIADLGIKLTLINSFVMTVENSGTTNALVTVYINGDKKIAASVLGTVYSGIRTAIIGAEKTNTGAFANHLDGEVDNFIVVNNVVTTATINNFKNDIQYVAPDTVVADFSLYVNFNDADLALEDSVSAVTKFDGVTAQWVKATVYKGSFVRHYSGSNYDTCHGWGDVHIYRFASLYGGDHVYGGEHLFGQYSMKVCPTQDFEVRVFTRYTCWWGATVTRAAVVRYKDYLWRANLDESHSSPDDTRAGTPYCRLGVSAGTFMKQINSATWIPFTGTFVHDATGVRYSAVGNIMKVIVPNVAVYQANLNGRYMDNYLTVNLAACPKTTDPKTSRRGWCDGYIAEKANIYFNEWQSPPALPDVEVTDDSPCDAIDATTRATISASCGSYYTVGTEIHTQCMYDACSSGDPDIIPTVDLPSACLQARLAGGDVSSCSPTKCRGSCYGRGTCNEATGVCTGCKTGYGGIDCYQLNSFNCHTVSYGVSSLNVEPKEVFTAAGISNNFENRLFEYSVWKSLLIYPVTYQGNEYLQFVASSKDNNAGGSLRVCVSQSNADALPSSPKFMSKSGVTYSGSWSGNNLCVDVTFQSFTEGGFYVQLQGKHSFTITLPSSTNVEQVLVASKNGKLGMDVARIPRAYFTTGFSYTVGQCDNSVCNVHDGDCFTCYKTTGCGYCIESGRCMLGSEVGPKRGICRNWRFNLDADVSRVVTTKYTLDDFVDPDYEVQLSSISAGSRVPVNIFVPVARVNENLDIMFAFGTAGSFAINAGPLKNNLQNTLSTLGDINFGISYYGDLGTAVTLAMTRVTFQNTYVFGRAMETPAGVHSNGGTGGQFNLLRTIGGEFGLNPGFRVFSRKLLVVTVYDIPSDDAVSFAKARQAILDKGILVVWLVVSGAPSSVSDYYKSLNDRFNGIPSITLSIDAPGSQFASLFQTLIKTATSFPHIVIADPSASEYTNVDIDRLTAESDALNIFGLTNTGLRAKFVVPMRQGSDSTNKQAHIIVPGFGTSVIVDIPNTNPTALDKTFTGKESSKCIPVTLEGYTYKTLFAPAFKFESLPTAGNLYVLDVTKTDSVGAAVSTSAYYTNPSFCFVPVPYDYSIPPTAAYATFSYKSTDGCLFSATRTISIIVNEVPESPVKPVSHDYQFTIYEDDPTPFVMTIEGFEADKNPDGSPQQVDFYYVDQSATVNLDLFSSPTQYFYDSASGNPLSFTSPYVNFVPDAAHIVSHNIEFVPPVANFFGALSTRFYLQDQSPMKLQSSVYKLNLTVVGVNDAPYAIHPLARNQILNEDSEFDMVLDGEDVDNFGLSVDVKVTSLQTAGTLTVNGVALTVGDWVTVCTGTDTVNTVNCAIHVKPLANENSCGGTMTLPAEPLSDAFIDTTCTTPYATFSYRVRDHNDKWVTSSSDSSVVEAFSAEKNIVVNVMAVNDPPITPDDVVINLKEDDPLLAQDIFVQDIDSTPDLLDSIIVSLPDFSFVQLSQAGGANIDTAPTTLDTLKRLYSELHTIGVKPVENACGTSKDANWYATSFYFVSQDQIKQSPPAKVTINIKPINDAPINLATSFSLNEDSLTEGFNKLDLTANDVDTPQENLVYWITAIPTFDKTLGTGVLVYPIDPVTGLPEDENIADLPFQVTLNAYGEAKVWIQNLHDWYGSASLTYTVTDADQYLTSDDADYRVNTVSSTVAITIVPVNDPPTITGTSQNTNEDMAVRVYLSGENTIFGEELDVLEVNIADITVVFSDSPYAPSSPPDVFFHYDETLYNALLAEGTSTTKGTRIPVRVGDTISVAPYSVIYIPPNNFNYDASKVNTPLYVFPSITYNMHETSSQNEPKFLSSPTKTLTIVTNAVNDQPVTWGSSDWNVGAGFENFYGPVAWTYPVGYGDDKTTFNNMACIDDCYYTEDFGYSEGQPASLTPRPIYFGGRDIEGDDLTVQIGSVDCMTGAEFFDASSPSTVILPAQLANKVFTQKIVRGTGYTYQSLLSFRPAINSWNLANPTETHASGNANLRDTYCTFTYTVIDTQGYASKPKTMNLYVRQKNDQPFEPTSVTAVVGYEDVYLPLRFSPVDLEGDDFTFTVTQCKDGKGTFYYPKSELYNHILSDGSLDTTDYASIFDLSTPIPCLGLDNTISPNPLQFSDTNGKGWYILFISSPNGFGTAYNEIRAIYEDGVTVGQTPTTTSRTLTIRSVSDVPVLTINGIAANNGGTTTYTVPTGQTINWGFSFDDSVDLNTLALQPTDYMFGVYMKVIPTFPASLGNEVTHIINYSYVSVLGPNTFRNINNNLASPANPLGYIYFKAGSPSQINDAIKFITMTFPIDADYTFDVMVTDGGNVGYCPPDLVKDTNTYLSPDLRAFRTPGTSNDRVEGALISNDAARCNRVAIHTVVVRAQATTSSITFVSSIGGAVVAFLGAMGAVLYANYKKPEDTAAWEALDAAMGSNTMTSGIHVQARTTVTSGIYESAN